jgi:regulator of protease activity HflC (stomatin/prohibitin superfamily)
MAWFIISIVLLIAGLFVAAFGRNIGNSMGVRTGAVVTLGVVLLGAGGVTLVFDSFTIIPTRSVGVVVAFGKPDPKPLTNGFHWVAPWKSVEVFDASVQTLKLTGEKNKGEDNPGDDGDPVTVRLGNQTTANVDVSVQWNIAPEGDVVELYRKYKNFDNIQANLVRRQLAHALNNAFGTYDPLKAINGDTDKPTQSTDDLAARARKELQDAVGSGITIGTLTIPIVHYDQATEDRLRAYQQALADTRIAEQKEKTAQATKRANDVLAGSQSTKDPGVQYQNCLDLIRDLANKGKLQDLPPTFTCSPTGAAPPVIVGQK